MTSVERLLLRVKRGEGPVASTIRAAYRAVLRWNVPQTPLLRATSRAAYLAHEVLLHGSDMLAAKLLYEPMTRARFASVGHGVHVTHLPYVLGHCKIHIGDGCTLSKIHVYSGRFVDEPELHIGRGTMIGWGAHLTVNRRVVIGEHVGIASHVTIADSDGHPAELDRRLRHEPITADDIRPVTIGDHVWIGRNAQILKGVTIGRGAVVGAGSVVTSDVPEGALAMGVPARIILRPWER